MLLAKPARHVPETINPFERLCSRYGNRIRSSRRRLPADRAKIAYELRMDEDSSFELTHVESLEAGLKQLMSRTFAVVSFAA